MIYGTAECIEQDPTRGDFTAQVFERLTGHAVLVLITRWRYRSSTQRPVVRQNNKRT